MVTQIGWIQFQSFHFDCAAIYLALTSGLWNFVQANLQPIKILVQPYDALVSITFPFARCSTLQGAYLLATIIDLVRHTGSPYIMARQISLNLNGASSISLSAMMMTML
jgi:hypothetical protein